MNGWGVPQSDAFDLDSEPPMEGYPPDPDHPPASIGCDRPGQGTIPAGHPPLDPPKAVHKKTICRDAAFADDRYRVCKRVFSHQKK